MDEPFNLVQIAVTMVRARESLIGINRALNQTNTFLENLPEMPMSEADKITVDESYERIPFWKNRLDLLYDMLCQMENADQFDVYDFNAFVHDFDEVFSQINTEMTELGKVLMKPRY